MTHTTWPSLYPQLSNEMGGRGKLESADGQAGNRLVCW